MRIELKGDHENWLRAQVAAGRYATFEDAVADAIESLREEDEVLAQAKPLVDEGLAELDRGESIPAQEVFAQIEARLRAKT
jgi:antitoxin ParD1/3/4